MLVRNGAGTYFLPVPADLESYLRRSTALPECASSDSRTPCLAFVRLVTHPPDLSRSSADLVARVRGGEARAFEELFRREYAALCRFADRYVDDGPASEDLVQDLFASIWSNRARLDVRGSLRAYLFTAVRNRALNVRKHTLVEREWAREETATQVRALHRPPRRPDHQGGQRVRRPGG